MNSTNENDDESTLNENEELINDRQTLIEKCNRLEAQIQALKEVSCLRKNLLDLREKESHELIEKLKYFEELVNTEKKYGQELSKRVTGAEHECTILMEKLGQNGFSLKEMKIEYENKIDELINKYESSQNEYKEIHDENIILKTRLNEDKSLEFKKLEKQLHLVNEKNRVLNFQMSLLHTLFTETENTPLDMNRVRAIGDLLRKSNESSEVVLNESSVEVKETFSVRKSSVDFDGIIERLDASESNFTNEIPGQESCYQSMDSIQGPIKVLSVSRTFIKIKDLILEKKSLKKEIDGLKQLNEKLFKKVDKQEKRLSNVTSELNKTWSLVTTLESQQQSLHNSRSALRYDLHEKRKLLEKIKKELHLSHEKWAKIKQKNSASEIEWNSIRDEFARRRLEESASRQSQESAFYEGPSSSNESNSNEEDEDEKDIEKRKILEDAAREEICGEETFINDPLDEFVSELVDEIEDIEAAADDEEEEDDDDDDDDEDEVINNGNTNWDALVNRRALRLRLLEEQCRLLYNKLKASSARNTDLATKLSNLHDHYGTENSPDSEQQSTSTGVSLPEFESDPDSTQSIPNADNTDDRVEVEVEDEKLLCLIPQHLKQLEFKKGSEIVIVPEPNILSEFIRLSPQPPQPSTSHNLTENSLESQNYNKDTTNSFKKELLVLMPNTSTTTTTMDDTKPNDSLSSTSTKKYKTKEMTSETTTTAGLADTIENTTKNFKIPIPPPLPPTRYYEQQLDGGESARSSPDLHVLGRLIIQQLPKRLEILKQENTALIQEALETKDFIRETQIELDCQKRMSIILQDQIKDQSDTEIKLRDELELQQQIINRLNEKLQGTYTKINNLEREKEKIENFLDLFIKDRIAKENRSEIKSKTLKNCDSCNTKFSIFKRKHHCTTCGNAICTKCTNDNIMVVSNSRMQKKVRFCSSCSERKQTLDFLTVSET